MFAFHTYLGRVAGIAVSVLLPIIWETVYRYFPKVQNAGAINAAARHCANLTAAILASDNSEAKLMTRAL